MDDIVHGDHGKPSQNSENPRKRGLFSRGRGTASKRSRTSFSTPKRSLSGEDCDTVRLTEKDFGITEYISNHCGFNGVIKQRYSDFLVNELNPDGSEVHLTTTDPPPIEEQVSKPSVIEATDALPQETWDKIAKLSADDDDSVVDILVTDMSKERRRYIHQVIKNIYGQTLTSNTAEKDGNKVITVSKPKKDAPKRSRDVWPDKKGEFVHFSIYKENMDTQEAINLLAHKLFLKAGLISYAGTKDRRAKTCQRACIKKVYPHKIAVAARTLRGICVGNFELCPSALQLGQLSGNRFQIVLRNVTATDEQINGAMDSLSKHGFINYYGLQRFGTQSIPTHHIGRALLKGNWQEAIELILKPRGPGESPNLQEMRQLWWKTRDAGQAFKILKGRDKCTEGQLLLGLIKCHKNDLVNALEFIPRNARLMYLHSYQSYIWNQVISRRIKEYGLQPVEGDLVFSEDTSLEELIVEEDVTKEPKTSGSSRLPSVRILKASEVSKFSLHNIVFPLPGHEVTYPGHAAAEWYEELMTNDGLSTAALKQNIRKYTLGGTYRKIVVMPSKVTWKLVNYNDATKPLLLSDLDILQNKSPIESVSDAKYKALVLDFCLPSSAYATMALREVLKCDTSARYQTTLNSYSVTLDKTPPTEKPSTEFTNLEESVTVTLDKTPSAEKPSTEFTNLEESVTVTLDKTPSAEKPSTEFTNLEESVTVTLDKTPSAEKPSTEFTNLEESVTVTLDKTPSAEKPSTEFTNLEESVKPEVSEVPEANLESQVDKIDDNDQSAQL